MSLTTIDDNGSATSNIPKDSLYEMELQGIDLPNSVKALAAKNAYANMKEHGGRRLTVMTRNEFDAVMRKFAAGDSEFLDENVGDAHRVLSRYDRDSGTYTLLYFDYGQECYVCKSGLDPDKVPEALLMCGVDVERISEDKYGNVAFTVDEKTPEGVTALIHFDDPAYAHEVENFECPVMDVRDFIGRRCYRCQVHCRLLDD